MGVGTPELLIILVIILLLFGGSKLPQLSRSIGSSIKELRKGIDDGVNEESPEKAKPAAKQTEK
ncbi:MAG: twin-arginine translocase TatA/TatE family subunit [Candidatus Saccharibacteria bacterium]|nr:MAG: twin-arginine translocase TatA/TatE family subunit [Candidatus Saccharibacteria bacterium]